MSIAKMFEAGIASARQDQERTTLAKFLQPALGGDKAAQQAIYGASPEQGMKVEGLAQQRAQGASEAARKQLTEVSTLMLRAPNMAAQVYPQFKQSFEALGLGVTLPDQFEPGALDAAKAFADGGDEPRIVAPGSALVGNDGRVVYERPFAPAKPDFQLYDGADGPVWLPKPGAGPQGAATAAPPSGGAAQVLDDAFIGAMIQQESGGNPNAVSPKGARGLMQLMPGTQRDPGFGVTPARDDSPEENVRVGRDYIGAMMQRYGDPELALAAYNYGPGNVDKALQASGGDKAAAIARMPAETQNYVRQVPQRMQGGIGAIPIQGVRPKPKADGAPSGYTWAQDGKSLVPIPGGPADRKANPTDADLAKAEMGLRKEVSDRLKEPRTVMTMYQKVQAAANSPSASSDLALIFAFMKMLDPGSVVREQEFANAQNAAGVPDQVRNAWNKARNGERLNPNQRAQFLATADQMAQQAGQQITNTTREYQGIADQYGYDPARATGGPDFRNVQTGQPKPSQPASDIDSLLELYN